MHFSCQWPRLHLLLNEWAVMSKQSLGGTSFGPVGDSCWLCPNSKTSVFHSSWINRYAKSHPDSKLKEMQWQLSPPINWLLWKHYAGNTGLLGSSRLTSLDDQEARTMEHIAKLPFLAAGRLDHN